MKSEIDLIRDLKSGDKDSLTNYLYLDKKYFLSQGKSFLDETDSLEAFHDAILKLIKLIEDDKFSGKVSLRRYLMAIYRNLIFTKVKRVKQQSIDSLKLEREIVAYLNSNVHNLEYELNIPVEVLDKKEEEFLQFIADLEKEQEIPKPINEAKIIFIGSGGVGKTSLINMILDGKYNPNELKTEGIQIRDWEIEYEGNILRDEFDALEKENSKESIVENILEKNEKLENPENIKTKELIFESRKIIRGHIWDFGGQEIMHATHKFFMTQRSVYVLVINPRTEDRYGDAELDYWLKLIKSYAGNSPIIIVVNKCETHKIDLGKGGLRDKYPQIISFIDTSCQNNIGISELKNTIKESVRNLSYIGNRLPATYFRVKELLEQANKSYLHYYQYREICKSVDEEFGDEGMKVLISLLNDLGIMLNVSDNRRLGDTYVLNPEWITNGVYDIINSDQLMENKGVISENEIETILNKSEYPSSKERGFIMDMMAHFQLCYQLDKKETYFIPSAFPKDKPDNFEWESNDVLRFQYDYDVLPSSIMSRFLVKAHDLIKDNLYWRNGVVLKFEIERSLAYIKADPLDKKIFIEISGTGNKRAILTYLRTIFETIHGGIAELDIKRIVPIDNEGNFCNYDDLLIYEEEGQENIFIPSLRKMLKVKALLNGIEDRFEKADLKNLIAQDKIEEALKLMCNHNKDDNNIYAQLGRLKKLTNDYNLGIAPQNELEINNLRLGILQMIDEI